MQITQKEGVKMIIDGVKKTTAEISLQCLARRGIFMSYFRECFRQGGSIFRFEIGGAVCIRRQSQFFGICGIKGRTGGSFR